MPGAVTGATSAHWKVGISTEYGRNMGNITHRAGKCCAGNDEGTCGSRAAYSAVGAVRWSAGRRVCVGWVTRCDGIRAKYGCKEHSPQLDVGVSRRRCDEGTCGSRAAYSAVSAVRWSGGRRECDGIWGKGGGWVCSACLARRSSAEACGVPQVPRSCFLWGLWQGGPFSWVHFPLRLWSGDHNS